MKFYIPPPGASRFLPLTGSTQAEFPSFSPEKEKLRAEGDLSSQLWARINFPGTTGLYWNSGLDSPLHPLRSLEAGGGGGGGEDREREEKRASALALGALPSHPGSPTREHTGCLKRKALHSLWGWTTGTLPWHFIWSLSIWVINVWKHETNIHNYFTR